jgi:hypothetical protein
MALTPSDPLHSQRGGLSGISADPALSPQPQTAVYPVGPENPQKGIDTALKALKILADKGFADRLELNLYGWDYSEWDYRQMARDLEVDRYVRFLPFENDVLGSIRRPTPHFAQRGEGLSNVLLEAMAMEMPVIASRVSGTVEVVDHCQKNGLLIPPGSPEALAVAMEAVLTQPELAVEWGRQARLKVQGRYSLDAVAQQYAQLYDLLVLYLSGQTITLLFATPEAVIDLDGQGFSDKWISQELNREILFKELHRVFWFLTPWDIIYFLMFAGLIAKQMLHKSFPFCFKNK